MFVLERPYRCVQHQNGAACMAPALLDTCPPPLPQLHRNMADSRWQLDTASVAERPQEASGLAHREPGSPHIQGSRKQHKEGGRGGRGCRRAPHVVCML